MKKTLILTATIFLAIVFNSNAETWIPNYGYFHYDNEKSAKKEIKKDVTKIFDFENSANAGGEKIEKGKYYIETKYKGKQDGNGIDKDYVYLEDLIGKDGKDGKDGVDGKDGKRGKKGDTGEQGEKGEKGDTGETGKEGADGKDGVNGVDGEEGAKGDKGDKGDRGKDVDPETVNNLQEQINQLQEPKYYLVPQVRVYDSKRLEVKPYAKFDVQNNFDFREAGLKVTVKIGKSYEEKLIQELAEKIETFVRSQTKDNLVDYTYDAEGHVIGVKTKF